MVVIHIYGSSKRFFAGLGDVVQITECRPLTRTMRWEVTGKVK